uniref:Uncharacterized protein n=1 Tax=Anguilla anguilla TaxID=7936 RepID=A0A0E9UAQ1_ANGAN
MTAIHFLCIPLATKFSSAKMGDRRLLWNVTVAYGVS